MIQVSKCASCYEEIKDKSVLCKVCNALLHPDCAIQDNGYMCDTCYTEAFNAPEVLEFDVPDVIRRSYIKEYDDCPYKFYVHHAKGLEQPPNIYAQMGIDLHELFERGSKEENYHQVDMEKDFRFMFDDYSDELFEGLYGNTTEQDMYDKGIASIKAFYDVIYNLESELHSAEKTYQFPVGEDLPLVQCTIDRVDKIDEKRLHVMDWKTGSVMVGKALSADMQPPLYIKAVQQAYPDMTVEKFTLYYLSENKERTYERVNDDNYICRVGKREYKINITDTVKKVQHIFSQINKGNFNIPVETKGMYYTCKMCHVRKAGMCEGAEMQVWNQFQ